ncbi:helix-turn-helix domain-containing protein [candidate division KSB1 bacterium]|nr:helix-turn-helix domain-containing protein [candidate division KSB1 bacterium]
MYKCTGWGFLCPTHNYPPHMMVYQLGVSMNSSECPNCNQSRKRYLSIKDAAEYLGLTQSALRSMITRRQIDFRKLDHRIRLDIKALDKALIPYPSINSV